MVMESSFVLLPALFVALMVNVKVFATEGVPVMVPSLFSVRPSGRFPLSLLHVMGASPSAARAWLYAAPTVPSGRLVVVMVGAVPLGWLCKAVKLTPKLADMPFPPDTVMVAM